MNAMTVEIWSDLVCPWCYIGKRRFEAALERFEHKDQVRVIWRSFELDPGSARRTPGSLAGLLASKFGISLEQAAAINDRVSHFAAAEGLEYRLDRAQHGNTFDAHRLIHLAAAHDLQDQATERLLRAYFTEGLPVGDAETLLSLGVEIGLPADEVRAMLAGDAYAAEVRADELRAQAFGIRGVPFVAIDETYGIFGAQTPDVLLDALRQAWAASHAPAGADFSPEDGGYAPVAGGEATHAHAS